MINCHLSNIIIIASIIPLVIEVVVTIVTFVIYLATVSDFVITLVQSSVVDNLRK